MHLKICNKKQVHLINIDDKTTLTKLQENIKSVFRKLPNQFQLTYTDNQNDKIYLFNDRDIQSLRDLGVKKMRIEVQEYSPLSTIESNQNKQITINDQSNILTPLTQNTTPQVQSRIKIDQPIQISIAESSNISIAKQNQLQSYNCQEAITLEIQSMEKEIQMSMENDLKSKKNQNYTNQNIIKALTQSIVNQISQEIEKNLKDIKNQIDHISDQAKMQIDNIIVQSDTKNQQTAIKTQKPNNQQPIKIMQLPPTIQKNAPEIKNQKKESEQKDELDEQIVEKILQMLPELAKKIKNQILKQLPIKQSKNQTIHYGVTCNECRTKPIVGIRYKCTQCFDYDLCEKCEAKTNHSQNHIFYKIQYSTNGQPQTHANNRYQWNQRIQPSLGGRHRIFGLY